MSSFRTTSLLGLIGLGLLGCGAMSVESEPSDPKTDYRSFRAACRRKSEQYGFGVKGIKHGDKISWSLPLQSVSEEAIQFQPKYPMRAGFVLEFHPAKDSLETWKALKPGSEVPFTGEIHFTRFLYYLGRSVLPSQFETIPGGKVPDSPSGGGLSMQEKQYGYHVDLEIVIENCRPATGKSKVE